MDKSSVTSSTKPPMPKRSPCKSNIQNKISAKKKRQRRSMTQPITGDDVSAAKEMVERTTSPEQEDEEESLSFAERLTYFNQLCAKTSPKVARSRNSLKRFNTQPVERDAVEEAQKLYNKNQIKEISPNTASAKSGDSPKVELSDDKFGEIVSASVSTENLSISEISVSKQVSTTSEIGSLSSLDEDSCITGSESSSKLDNVNKEGTTKVGKLSKNKLKFLENKEKSEVEKSSRSPRKINGNSESSDSSSVAKRLRERSLSPLVVRQLSSTSLTSSGDSTSDGEAGKDMEREIKSSGSIHDRLKLLEKNREEDWKRRVKKDNHSSVKSLGERMSKLQGNEEKWKSSKPDTTVKVQRESATSKANISDRLNLIIANSEKWKEKSGKQNDATQFTVHAKAHKREGSTGVPIASSPSLKRKVLPVAVSNEPVITIDDVKNDEPSLNKLSEVLKLSQKGLEEDVIKKLEETTQEIPMMDDHEFNSFFSSSSPLIHSNGVSEEVHENGNEETENTQDSWMEIEETFKVDRNTKLSDIGRLKSRVKRPTARNKRSARNPLKALAAREDIKQSYTEQRSNISKLEQQRLASLRGNHFTSAALAGLAYKADFSKVNLKSTKTQPAFTASDLQPWSDKMLLRVKGRRHVQTRLVEPCAASLNSGDAFLLVMTTKLYAWFGEFSNVIEKVKVQEIADYIIHKGDLGSKATSLTIIDELKSSAFKSKEFFSHIGGIGEFQPYGGDQEDELYEVNAEAAIKSYKLEDSKLVPYKESWGKLPTMAALNSLDTYVFDFGAEMYIWQGKEVSFNDRQLAVRLARTLWDQGYDYTDVGFCPFVPIKDGCNNLKGSRPEWGLFARVNENLETSLVQEKFEDWSNISREIGDRDDIMRETSRGHIAAEMKTKVSIKPEMVACDVKLLRSERLQPLPLHLEDHNLWRGHGHMYDDDGRGLLVVTSSVDTWYATDKNMVKVEEPNQGVFHRSETYVVRWKYVVSSTGKVLASKSKPGSDLKSAVNGRERTAYFLWAGRDSSVNEKGASALMATEIDTHGGPQMTVHEGREPAAMRQCFGGRMLVVDGKIGKRDGFYSWKLFCMKGTSSDEATLYQIPCESQSLRSRSSLMLLNGRLGKIVVWHGKFSPQITRKLITEAANKIKEEKPLYLGFRSNCKSVEFSECEEGSENQDVAEGIGRIRRTKYMSLLETTYDKLIPPRAWHLLPSGDEFISQELHPVTEFPSDEEEKNDVEFFPLVQEQFKELMQPAFVLVETTEGVYLWQSEVGESMKGSGKRQFDISRRLALETTVNYCKEYRSDFTPMLIHELHEPIEFTNSFLVWMESKKKLSFEERRANKPTSVSETLSTLSRLTYSIEELRATPLPEGVDPNHLETYLSQSDFEKLFQISKEEFYDMPPWKQSKLRKEKNLF